MRLFVTGFGPFLEVKENPSGTIASRLGLPYRLLDVTFSAADSFLDEFETMEFDALLMIGVAKMSTKMRFECVARNTIGATPDVGGVVMGPGPVHAPAPQQLHAPLWAWADRWVDDRFEVSVDAGSYLCNYIAFEAVRRFPERTTGFLHVPMPTPELDIDTMVAAIRELPFVAEALAR